MKGFDNLGNTCYLNSGLQMIIQNEDLCKIISEFQDSSDTLNKIYNFIKKYYNGKSNSISPKCIKNFVTKRNSIFTGTSQQDSAEFIIFFLDFLNEEINKVSDKKNIIDDIFNINLQVMIKCKSVSCLNISKHDEKSTMMILPISVDDKTLDDCYRNYKKRVKLEEDEKYFCEYCKKKRIASKRFLVTYWPKHLIIWLTRYQDINGRLSKNNQEIKIPLEWRHEYKLKGIVFHSGSLYSGHYIYAGLNDNNNTWYLYNDSSVSELKKKSLIHLINNGYIYYFVKC